jgi:hypothetical protein
MISRKKGLQNGMAKFQVTPAVVRAIRAASGRKLDAEPGRN